MKKPRRRSSFTQMERIANESHVPKDIIKRMSVVIGRFNEIERNDFIKIKEAAELDISKDPSNSKEWNLKILKFIFEHEEKQAVSMVAKILADIHRALEARFPKLEINRKPLIIETSFGNIQLSHSETGFNLYVSSLKLGKEVFGEVVNEAAPRLPKVLESFARENLCIIQKEKDGYSLKYSLGTINYKIERGQINVNFSSIPACTEFLEKINTCIRSEQLITLVSKVKGKKIEFEYNSLLKSTMSHMNQSEREKFLEMIENEELGDSKSFEYLMDVYEAQRCDLVAKVWGNLLYRLCIKYPDSLADEHEASTLRTPAGTLEIDFLSSSFVIRISSIALAKEILGADVESFLLEPPKLLQKIAKDDKTLIIKEPDGYNIKGLLGDIILKTIGDTFFVKIDKYKIRVFFENLYINFQN